MILLVSQRDERMGRGLSGLCLKRISFRWVISTVIGITVLGYCLSQIKLEPLLRSVIHVSWHWLFLGMVALLINQTLRSLRFLILIHSKKANFYDLFKVQCLYSLFCYILPLKTGDLSYIYFIKKYMDVPPAEGIATLLISRVVDYMAISFLFFYVLFLIWEEIPYEVKYLVFPVAAILSIVLLFSVLVLSKGKVVVRLMRSIEAKKIGGRITKFIRSIRIKSEDVIDSFQKINQNKVYLKVFTISILVWLALGFASYSIIRGLGYQADYLIGLATAVLLFPISFAQNVGNLGTHEAEWIPVLLLFGFGEQTAISIALASHAFMFLYILIMAGCAKIALIASSFRIRK